jgi:hypothetical protein
MPSFGGAGASPAKSRVLSTFPVWDKLQLATWGGASALRTELLLGPTQ